MIAKRLSDSRPVITVDMRNHGQSPRAPTHSYPDLADDLAQVINHLNVPVDVCGHSMGGKAAMVLALQNPTLLRRLIVADIAPVAYGHTQQMFIDAMRAVDLTTLSRRSDAESQLAEAGVERALQSFFTQSLDVPNKRWRLNLDVLEAEMPKIIGWPDVAGQFDGPTLFCRVVPPTMSAPNTATTSNLCSRPRALQNSPARAIGFTPKSRASSRRQYASSSTPETALFGAKNIWGLGQPPNPHLHPTPPCL